MPADPSYIDKVHILLGGDTLEVASGGSIVIYSGGSLVVGGVTVDASTLAMTGLTASAAELNAAADGAPASCTFVIATGGSANICLVTIQVVDADGAAIAGVAQLDVWLSDASTGIGLTATTASGAVGAGASGTDLGVLTTKKATRVLTDATGKYILSITDSAKTHFYVAACVGGRVANVSAQLAGASYA